MTKHTPGPWRYVDGYFDCDVWAGNKKVLSYERHPTDEDRANARLMAAAPELLEALEAILNTTPVYGLNGNAKVSDPDEMKVGWNVHMIARAAIASATEAV